MYSAENLPSVFLKLYARFDFIRLKNTSDKLKKERSFMTLFKAFS